MKKVNRKYRIYLVDDHPVVRQGLGQLLTQQSYEICGESGSYGGTMEKIGLSKADLAVVDISLGEESGLELISDLRDSDVRVLVYSMHEDAEMIEKAFAAGAGGYVSKRESADILSRAVSELLRGHRYMGPLVAQSLASDMLAITIKAMECKLSNREKKILALLGRGETNADIASTLFISVRTVETYFYRVISKLGFKSMKELRKYAIKNFQ